MLRRARLRVGERLLVVGVGGGVASAGLVIGQAMGAEVFVTSRSPEKVERALELGATRGFDSTDEFSKEVAALGGVDVVLENVGPATFEQSLRSLVRGGRLVISGGTSGAKASFKIPYLFFKHLEIIGSSMLDHREFQEVTRLVGSGRVPVVVDSVFDFEDLPKALARMDSGEQFGKIVLRH
jgi:NADPH:quinone reductase-like Zn-dependent oxidoreductase